MLCQLITTCGESKALVLTKRKALDEINALLGTGVIKMKPITIENLDKRVFVIWGDNSQVPNDTANALLEILGEDSSDISIKGDCVVCEEALIATNTP